MRRRTDKENKHFIIIKVEGQRPLDSSRSVKKILRIISMRERTVVDMMNRMKEMQKIINNF